MFGSEILDAAIGLVFLFLLLSLICSSIKEALETVLKYRARDLERGIREMFGGKNAGSLVSEFYSHPLISSLFKGDYIAGKAGNLPSYIPPSAFALAVIDLCRPAKADSATPPAQNALADLRNAVLLTQNTALQGALLPLIDAAGGDLGRARRNIEDWYNASMDRVSGWYKRRTQQIIAGVGLLIAVSMNIDTVAIARYLNTSQTARSLMIAAASKPDVTDPLGFLERQGGIPLGWVYKQEPNQTEQDFQRDWRRVPSTAGGWLMKLAGLLFTTFAISLGAPFWFDILNKFMVVRSTVKPDEKSAAEPSKG